MPNERKDLAGQKFGKWTVLEYLGRSGATAKGGGFALWRCRCECGSESVVRTHSLTQGGSVQCRKCSVAGRFLKHGLSRSPVYKIYHGILQRCGNKNHPEFHNYGARGIKVCDRWKESFEAFYEDMGEFPGKGYSIDRIDNDGDYSPENCRWATWEQQTANKRTTRWIEYQGRKMIIRDWAKEFGLTAKVLTYRLDMGWPIEVAFTEKVRTSIGRNARKRFTNQQETL